jgi:hypothetical protein
MIDGCSDRCAGSEAVARDLDIQKRKNIELSQSIEIK